MSWHKIAQTTTQWKVIQQMIINHGQLYSIRNWPWYSKTPEETKRKSPTVVCCKFFKVLRAATTYYCVPPGGEIYTSVPYVFLKQSDIIMSSCFAQSCEQYISGRQLPYERILDILHSEEYLKDADLQFVDKRILKKVSFQSCSFRSFKETCLIFMDLGQ